MTPLPPNSGRAAALLRNVRDLDGRPLNLTRLARRVGAGRSHLWQVWHGRRNGPETRGRVLQFLNPSIPACQQVRQALGWEPTQQNKP